MQELEGKCRTRTWGRPSSRTQRAPGRQSSMHSHKEQRKEKRKSAAATRDAPPHKKHKPLKGLAEGTSGGAPQQGSAPAERKAQALGAWNPKATLVKGAQMDASVSTSLLLFYQYIQPLWTEVPLAVPAPRAHANGAACMCAHVGTPVCARGAAHHARSRHRAETRAVCS